MGSLETFYSFIILEMNEKQHQVLIGLLLGDLHLQKTDSTTGKCRLRLSHTLEQKDYTDWIYQLFIDWCVKTQARKRVDTNKGYSEYRFYSEYRMELIPYHDLFYKKPTDSKSKSRFVKILPDNLDSLLTSAQSLAVWYMDDGTKRTDCNSGRIATQGFTETECDQLINCIWQNFSILLKKEPWTYKNRKKLFGLCIPSKDGVFQKWCDLIRPYMIPPLDRKLYISSEQSFDERKNKKDPVTTEEIG